jgi:metal-responsive CopG/Arc/MetJ family transcriptional regulator
MSRSEFFTVAARHYIEELDAQSLTARIDAVIDLVGADESSAAAVAAGRRTLAADTDEW